MRPLIFDAYPRLEELPWIELGDFPTPIEKLEKYGKAVGLPNLYIKRDDRSSKLYGGNKVRKLEFVLADARRKGRRVLITVGGTGSNQVLATGIFGKQLGFNVVGVMMDQPNAEYVRRNLLLDHHFGVEIHYTPNIPATFLTLAIQYLKHTLRGQRPYYITRGASSPLGDIGFVNAIFELKQQIDEGVMPEPDYIVVAAGSMGTTAGLDLGCRLTGLKTKVVAVRIAMPWMVNAKNIASTVNKTCEYMRALDSSIPPIKISEEDVILLTDYLGPGYAHLTDNALKTIALMKELEGIPLDPTYTGKALGGAVDWLKKNNLEDKVALFWNTYNSIDLSHLIEDADYHDLPKPVHRYFEQPTQEELQAKKSEP